MLNEFAKIVVGLIVAAVGSAWTLYTWQANEERRSDKGIAAISDVIVMTHANCRKADGVLNNLFAVDADGEETSLNKRQKNCITNFVKLRQAAYSGPILIGKPFSADKDAWWRAWKGLQDKVEQAGDNSYDHAAINEGWKKILQLKSGEDPR